MLYVFGQQPVDLEHCKNEFKMMFPDKSTPIIIMCDVEYSYATESLTAELAKTYQHIIPTIIQTESKLQTTLDKTTKRPAAGGCCSRDDTNNRSCCSRQKVEIKEKCCGQNNCDQTEEEEEDMDSEEESTIIPPSAPIENVDELKAEMKRGGRYFELPENILMEDCSIFFIGTESLTLTNIMMVHNKCPVNDRIIPFFFIKHCYTDKTSHILAFYI